MTDYPHDATVTITDDHTGRTVTFNRNDYRAFLLAAAEGASDAGKRGHFHTVESIYRAYDHARIIGFPENTLCVECGTPLMVTTVNYCDNCWSVLQELDNDMTEATMMQSGY